MALSFWDWDGDQTSTRAYLRPNFRDVDDKNVNPDEMVRYVQEMTGLGVLSRVAGDLELLKGLVAAGFPVIIEKGFEPPGKDWLGHYVLVTGYDDDRQRFTTQDSYIGDDFPEPYDQVSSRWRDFNFVYIVIYPPEREGEVLAIIGPHVDAEYNLRYAADLARREIETLTGRDQFFAWYNLGTNLAALSDFAGAAQAYDQAFAIYANLGEAERPWRMLWYQAGPYPAYYYTGRYEDLAELGNLTLNQAGGPLLEETYYWLGMAREAQGDMEKAHYDFRKAVEINPSSTRAMQECQRLGITCP
jgi:tetratricopeptide (TPR) repeat protein